MAVSLTQDEIDKLLSAVHADVQEHSAVKAGVALNQGEIDALFATKKTAAPANAQSIAAEIAQERKNIQVDAGILLMQDEIDKLFGQR